MNRRLFLFALSCSASLLAQSQVPAGFEAWTVSIEKRVYAGSFSRQPGERTVKLTGCRNEFLTAQLACRNSRGSELSYQASALRGPGGAEIPAGAVRVRFGAYLPVDETGQYTADPLLESKTVRLPANLAQPVWITIHVPKRVKPGAYSGALKLAAGGQSLEAPLQVEVLSATLPDPPDYSFYLNLWQDPNGVARAHKAELWSESHWQVLARYAENLAAHGEKSIMTSLIHDPWNAQTGYIFPTGSGYTDVPVALADLDGASPLRVHVRPRSREDRRGRGFRRAPRPRSGLLDQSCHDCRRRGRLRGLEDAEDVGLLLIGQIEDRQTLPEPVAAGVRTASEASSGGPTISRAGARGDVAKLMPRICGAV